MKIINLIILSLVLFSINISAFYEDEPTIAATGRILKEIKVKKAAANSANNFAEINLFIKASVADASWQTKGAEAAVLTVFVDGIYNQDAILFAGETTFEYQMLLGKYDLGEHLVTIVLNEKRSAPNARKVKIQTAFSSFFEDLTVTKPAERSIPVYIAMINAPVIYLRPDTIDKFSDIPLLTYYEIFDEPERVKRIRYTTVFTNEDGGTESAALMARWGRMTDIEWIYEIRVRGETGEILSEIYQAANHATRNFQGKRFGSHPLVLDATVNNNFVDAGCSALRVSPRLVQTNLSDGSRETVMDAFSWTYRIMAEEALREGRVNPANLGANTIADLRDYFYVELRTELENAAVAVEIEDKSGAKTASDYDKPLLRVNRSGFVRIAVRKPANQLKNQLASINVRCHAVSGAKESVCKTINVLKTVELDRNFQPRETKLNNKPQTLKKGGTGKFAVLPNFAAR